MDKNKNSTLSIVVCYSLNEKIWTKADNSIYGNMDWDLDGDGMMTLTGSHFFTTESPEMRRLRQIFQEEGDYEHGEYYIFIMQQANATGEPNPEFAVMGDMPRGQHFGFVFMNAVRQDQMARLIAHELGHGIFTLRHTFDSNYGGVNSKRRTDNLMDYGQGTELAAFQWNVMNNPAWITRFDSEEEGQWRIRDIIGMNRRNQEFTTRQVIEALRFGYAFSESITIDFLGGTNFEVSNITLGDGNRHNVGVVLQSRTIEFNPQAVHISRNFSRRDFPGLRIGFNNIAGNYSVELVLASSNELENLSNYIFCGDTQIWQRHINNLFSLSENGCQNSLYNLLALPNEALSRLSVEQRIGLLQRTYSSNIGCMGTQAAVLRIIESFNSPSDQERLLRSLTPQMKVGFFRMYISSDVRSRLITILSSYRLNQLPPETLWTLTRPYILPENAPDPRRRYFHWERNIGYSARLNNQGGIQIHARSGTLGHNQRTANFDLMDYVAVRFVDAHGGFERNENVLMTAFEFYWIVREQQFERQLQQFKRNLEIASVLVPGTLAVRSLRVAVRAGRFWRVIDLGIGVMYYTYDLVNLYTGLDRYLREIAYTDVWARNFLTGFDILRTAYNLSSVTIMAAGPNRMTLSELSAIWSLRKDAIRRQIENANPNNQQIVDETMNELQQFIDEINRELR